MKCSHHPNNEIVGYCCVCGELGCEECISEHEGQLYCRKHYRPIQRQLEEERKHEAQRKKLVRQRLVVRYKDGRVQHGVCFALNPKDSGFHLDLVDDNFAPMGESEAVRFSDVKAVFFVKSFDGKFDKNLRYRDWTPEGNDLVVEFDDSEVIRGRTLHRYSADDPRFFLIPDDPKSNNISMLVERSALANVFTPEEYKSRLAEKREARKKHKEESTQLSQEESLGDFYFETRNYDAAIVQYRLAADKTPHSGRIRRKLLTTKYNVGVQHIKRREYREALDCMEEVLSADPRNQHALKKVAQLRRIIEKGERARTEGKTTG